MNIIQKMQSYRTEMTESEYKVYETVMKDPTLVMRYTISQLAMMADTSVAAVLRFCQRIGFGGYKDFRSEIMIWQRENEKLPDESEDIVSRLSRSYSEAINELGKLDRETLRMLCADIYSCEKVVILSRYRSSTAAEKLRMNLIDLGITVMTGTNLLDFQHLLYVIDEKTAIIMFSTTGEINDQKNFLGQLSQQTQKIWLLTAAQNAKMSAYANHTVLLPTPAVTNVFAGSQSVMLAFADILTALLSECRNSCEGKVL